MPYDQDIEHALISFASNFPPYNSQPIHSITDFSSGMVFAHLLATVDHFPLSLKDLESSCEKWVEKLTNLKIIVQRMEAYIKDSGKTLITKDIDLIEIAKQGSSVHTLRFFELVVSVFMQSPHKEEYIQTIMHLDERSQHALVVIVQNAIDERMTDISRVNMENKMNEQIQELANQNQLLRDEIKDILATSEKYRREVMVLRQRVEELQDLEEKYRHSGVESLGNVEIQALRTMNDNIKQKLLQMARQHQQEILRAREESIFIQNKMIHFKEFQETIEHLKEQLAEAQGDRDKVTQQEREKRKLSRIVEEKEATIRQLKEKLEETNEKNYTMQENELYMKMELEKKEVRFRQLQNQVKNRLKAEPFTVNTIVPATNHTLDNDQLDYLQEELQKLRANHRQLQRQNLKLKKKVQKSQSFEGEKKRLQKIILDVSKTKDFEIEMLLVSLYQLWAENSHIRSQLPSLK